VWLAIAGLGKTGQGVIISYLARRGQVRSGTVRQGRAWRGRLRPGKTGQGAIIPYRAGLGLAWLGRSRSVQVGQGNDMPKSRQPREIWRETRRKVWNRDGRKCVHCGKRLRLNECHIDHIRSGKLGTNQLSNLRTLCRICHATRADHRHQALTMRLVRTGELPPNWRELVWED